MKKVVPQQKSMLYRSLYCVKQLQDEIQRLQVKWSKLEERVIAVETEVNSVNQYGRQNKIVFTGIPESVQDDQLSSLRRFSTRFRQNACLNKVTCVMVCGVYFFSKILKIY